MDSSWVQQEAQARKPLALGVWQSRTLSNVLTWQKLSPQEPVSLKTIIFFNPCVFEGKFNLSASDSFTLNSSKSCFALCYFMASKLEFNLEIACGPGKGPTPRHETQTQILF